MVSQITIDASYKDVGHIKLTHVTDNKLFIELNGQDIVLSEEDARALSMFINKEIN